MMKEEDMAGSKRILRREVEARRRAQPDKEGISRRILARACERVEFQAARTILVYVSARSEVRTADYLPEALSGGKRVLVPHCLPDRLELYRLESLDDLSPGTWGILEPRADVRRLPDRRAGIEDADFAFVPGVAFDRRGGRLGHGKAYFDKLLRNARPETTLAAVAFECQLVERVPMEAHDVWMDLVITENSIYEGRRKNQDA